MPALTALQVELIERHRQQSSGRMTARQEPAKPDLTDTAFIAGVWAYWNGPAIKLPDANSAKQ